MNGSIVRSLTEENKACRMGEAKKDEGCNCVASILGERIESVRLTQLYTEEKWKHSNFQVASIEHVIEGMLLVSKRCATGAAEVSAIH